MQPSELREAIATLRLTAEGFARCLGVSGRAVRMWLAGDRPIPAPAACVVALVSASAEARLIFIAGAARPQIEEKPCSTQ